MLELALEAKVQRLDLSVDELAVLAMCTFKHEVEASDYEAILSTASRQNAGRVVDALIRIGMPATCGHHRAYPRRFTDRFGLFRVQLVVP